MIGLSILVCAAIPLTLFSKRRPPPKLPAGWRWVEIDYIGLAVPDTFQLSKVQGVEGEFSQLSDGHTLIDAEVDGRGMAYDSHRSEPGYSEQEISIDGNDARLVFYQGTEPDQLWVPSTTWSLKYYVGLEIVNPALFRSRTTSVRASCPSEEERDKATSILKSIRVEKHTWSYFRLGPGP